MRRRRFLQGLSCSGALAPVGRSSAKSETGPPFKVIYSNDTTHIRSCIPPGPDRDKPFTDENLRKSILEASAADAHFLQPGLGWIPWWKSEIYSIADHLQWLEKEYGVTGRDKITQYLLEGGDMLQTLVQTCGETDIAPFLSFRLNDGHHTRSLKKALASGKPSTKFASHYWENYEEFRIGPSPTEWQEAVFDWSIPEVRNYKFSLIEEACANYDLAGLELDFLRHWTRFGDSTPAGARREITTAFVAKIRAMLDRTAAARGLPRRWLCARIPAISSIRPEQGIHLAELEGAGVDMFNLSHGYFTWQNDSVQQAREEVAQGTALYLEMTHTTMTGKATAGSGTQPFLRTTDEQFYTTARYAYEQGATGVSLFNFPYYRYHVTDTIGPFHEPPFHVIPKLKDREFLEVQPQWAFLSAGRNDPVLGERILPAILKRSHSTSFQVRMLSTANHPAQGILRLRSDEDISDRDFSVSLNGTPLERIEPVTEPLETPYAGTWLGKPDELACFRILRSNSIKPLNNVKITVISGTRVRLIYLDLVLYA